MEQNCQKLATKKKLIFGDEFYYRDMLWITDKNNVRTF